MEHIIMNEKLVFSFSVKTEVCVMNPGPIADVAIRNAEPKSVLLKPLGSFDADPIA